MRIWAICLGFVMLIGALVNPVAHAQPAPSYSEEELQERWGVLLDLAGKDFLTKWNKADQGSSWRWEVAGQILVEKIWNNGTTLTRRFVSSQSGELTLTTNYGFGSPNWVSKLAVQPDGAVRTITGSSNFLGSGNFHIGYARDGSVVVRREGRNSDGIISGPAQAYLDESLMPKYLKKEAEKRRASSPLQASIGRFNPARIKPAEVATLKTGPSPTIAPGSPASSSEQGKLAAVGKATASIPSLSGAGGPRIALVVGVSVYGTLGDLPNPTNDARALAAALGRSGFQVELVLNPDQRALRQAIARLGGRMAVGGAGSTGLFFFAGHGIQSRGVNYLIPAGAQVEREADLEIEGIPADSVLRQMEEAGVSTNIMILDACRNMPLTRSFRSGARGLAQMQAPNGSFIAYSTAPGSTAADGEGSNSPFAAALIEEIDKRGQTIEAVFRNVRRNVLKKTLGAQTPWDASSLLDPFYFVP